MKIKRFLKNFSLLLGIILLNCSFLVAFDEQTIISCGGDAETIMGCQGDSELFFMGAVPITTATSSSSDSSGGGGMASAKLFDIDFSEVSGATLSFKEEDTKTFSFNGQTSHTLNVLKINKNSVEMIIQSEPIILTLNVGEQKMIDFNSDGKHDLEIRLVSLSLDKAFFSFHSLEGATTLGIEESKTLLENLFDISIIISETNRNIYPGENVTALITIANNNSKMEGVLIEYHITSSQNSVQIASGFETVVVETEHSFKETLSLPRDIPPGNYLFNVQVSYNNRSGVSSAAFDVQKREKNSIESYMILISILVICGIYYLLLRKKERHLR
ncbi:MAG: hypothetical protein RL557_218 [archaeon]